MKKQKQKRRSRAAMRVLLSVAVLSGCARTDVYYPYGGSFDGKSGPPGGGRAVVLNGSDSLGNTVIDVTSGGVRLSSAGGIDNSTSTGMGYRTLRYGIGAAAWAAGAVGVANVASNAYRGESGRQCDQQCGSVQGGSGDSGEQERHHH